MSARVVSLGNVAGMVRHVFFRGAEIAGWLAPPVVRVALALPFLRSGLTRWDGVLSISQATLFLFEDQFRLHILGQEYALPAPDQLAWLTATAEVVLPALLMIGFATRIAALGLLTMSCVIQLVFPDGWTNFHLYWVALALSTMATGPGVISIDHWIVRGKPWFSSSRATQ